MVAIVTGLQKMLLFGSRFYLYVFPGWLLEIVAEISVYLYKILIEINNLILWHHVKAARYFVCNLDKYSKIMKKLRKSCLNLAQRLSWIISKQNTLPEKEVSILISVRSLYLQWI